MSEMSIVEKFLVEEARLLDERKFEQWRDLFVEDGYYWAPSVVGQVSPQSDVSLYYDDKALMDERITRLRHPRVHAQTPASRTSHMVINISLESGSIDKLQTKGENILVRSKILVCEYRPSIPEGIKRFFAGTAWHSLRWVKDEGLRINYKKVELVDSDAAFEPLAIYW